MIVLCFVLPSLLQAEQKQFSAGLKDNWSIVSSFYNTRLEKGKRGFLDLVLEQSRYDADTSPADILIHFEQYPFQDSSGNYSVANNGGTHPVPRGRIGSSAGFFSRENGGLTIQPLLKSAPSSGNLLFSPGTLWNDFSIEFWLHPEYLENGESILTWHGQRDASTGVQQQYMSCTVKDRKLVWEFSNFFLHPDSSPVTFSLEGAHRLVPERWSHHLIRFEAASGVLEYLVDGDPQTIIYTTLSSFPGGTVLLPFIGNRGKSELTIGEDYSGMIDEFRFSPAYVQDPLFHRLPLEGGTVLIGPIYLEEMGSQLISIDVDSDTPPGSSLFCYYRLAEESYDFYIKNPEWTSFSPGELLNPVPTGAYVQIKCELFPDGSGMKGPSISSLSVSYRPNLPPPAPVGLSAVPRDGAVQLTWNGINQRDAGGYLVFYGTSPGVYRCDDSAEGASPVDAGTATEIKLTSLKNGTLYYFSVAAYDTLGPAHRGGLSGELAARPSAYYGE